MVLSSPVCQLPLPTNFCPEIVKVGQKVGQAKCKIIQLITHSIPRPAELRNMPRASGQKHDSNGVCRGRQRSTLHHCPRLCRPTNRPKTLKAGRLKCFSYGSLPPKIVPLCVR